MSLVPPGKRGNKFWVWRERIAGKNYERSTGTLDKRVANRLVKQWREEALGAAMQTPGSLKTFSEVADLYIEATNASRNTERYLAKLKADELGRKHICDITPGDVQLVAARLYPEATNETKNRQAITPAASVLHWANEQEWIPYLRIKRLPERKGRIRRAKRNDVLRLIEAAEGDLRKLLITLYYQGWRISEALTLRRPNVDFENGTVRLYVGKVLTEKSMILHPETAAALKAGQWHRGDYAFPWADRHGVYRELRPLCKAVGVKLTPHMLRHTYASELAERGAGPKDLVALGSWTDEKSVLRYMHPSNDHLLRLTGSRGTVGEKAVNG